MSIIRKSRWFGSNDKLKNVNSNKMPCDNDKIQKIKDSIKVSSAVRMENHKTKIIITISFE
jgi:hypothetical protein